MVSSAGARPSGKLEIVAEVADLVARRLEDLVRVADGRQEWPTATASGMGGALSDVAGWTSAKRAKCTERPMTSPF